MGFSIPSLLSGPSSLGKRPAFWTLASLGGVLAATMLLDVYIDWVRKGEPLWAPLLENVIPIGLALTLVYAGRTVYQRDGETLRLAEMAKWAVIGCVGIVLLSGSVIWLHVFPEHVHLGFFVLQLGTVGAVAGLWVGHNIAGVREAEQEMSDQRDRLENLLDGLPAPIVHGRLEGDKLRILKANTAFEEVFGPEGEEVSGRNLYDIVRPEEQAAVNPGIDRKALQHGHARREVRYQTNDGPRDFQLRVARALDDGASETYSIYVDLTDQKRRKQELESIRDQMELALKHTDALLFGIDLETETVWRRGSFQEFFGLQAEEVSTMDAFFERAIHPEDRGPLRRFYHRLEQGERTSGEIEYRTHPERGRTRWIRDHVHAVDAESQTLLGLAKDVTQRKNRQDELRRKERRYQAVFDDPNILVGLLTPAGNVLDINRTALGYVDSSLDDLQGKSFWNTPWFEGDEHVQEQVREWVRRASEGEYVEFEVDLSESVGEALVVRGVVRPVKDERGEVTTLLISDRDITEQKEREKALQRTTARLTALYENSPDMIDVHDQEGTIIDSNPRFRKKTGYNEDDLIGMKIWEIDREISPDQARAQWEEMERGDRVEVEGAYRRQDGTVFPVEVHVRKLDLEGEDRFMAISRDITAQKERETELRDARRRMELALQHTGSVIFEIDLETREVTRHGVFEDFFNASPEELPTWDVFAEHAAHPDDRKKFFEFYRRLEEGGQESGTLEYRTSPETGEVRWIRDIVFVEQQEGHRWIRGLAQDVTEQKERTRELRDAKEEAEEASRLKSAMLANMSHELRTPLTAITGFSEVLKANLEGEMEVCAKKIHGGSRRLQQTLESVLHLSMLEAGVESLDREEVALQEVVDRVTDVLAPRMKKKSHVLKTKGPDHPVVGHWNEDAVHRICRNLVENAIKFTSEGGHIEVRVEKEEGEAVLEVEDTGIGMYPEKVPELFKAFKQESEGLDRNYEGSGLGLSIVKRLVEELAGTISVDTEKGEGACFTVRLPRGDDHAEAPDPS